MASALVLPPREGRSTTRNSPLSLYGGQELADWVGWSLDMELGVQSVTASVQDRAGQEEKRTGRLLFDVLLQLLQMRGTGLPFPAGPGSDIW